MFNLFIATSNPGKILEIKTIFSDLNLNLILLRDLGIDNSIPKEVGNSYFENAKLKALYYGKKSKLLTISEDSGLEVDFLEKGPGIYSARFSEGSDIDRCEKLLLKLKGVAWNERKAKYKAVIVLYDPVKESFKHFTGETDGFITYKMEGKNGFGYDPIFFSSDLNKTFAQSLLVEKNKVSHRMRALEKVKKYLQNLP